MGEALSLFYISRLSLAILLELPETTRWSEASVGFERSLRKSPRPFSILFH